MVGTKQAFRGVMTFYWLTEPRHQYPYSSQISKCLRNRSLVRWSKSLAQHLHLLVYVLVSRCPSPNESHSQDIQQPIHSICTFCEGSFFPSHSVPDPHSVRESTAWLSINCQLCYARKINKECVHYPPLLGWNINEASAHLLLNTDESGLSRWNNWNRRETSW